jgi:hypothetical protein
MLLVIRRVLIFLLLVLLVPGKKTNEADSVHFLQGPFLVFIFGFFD